MKKLRLKWSPETIAGRLYRDYPSLHISHEAFYQFIYDRSTRTKHHLVPFLARAHKPRRPRTDSHRHKMFHIPHRVSIKEGLLEVQTRMHRGHWEADTLVSRRSRAALEVILERTSRHLHLDKLPAKTSRSFRGALTRKLSSYPQLFRRSITYDNGCENVEHGYTNKVLGTQSYFCEPFHSWEKASIENAIGLIRRFFPKKSDLALVPKEQVKRVEILVNTGPGKCLNYQTSNEVLNSCVALHC